MLQFSHLNRDSHPVQDTEQELLYYLKVSYRCIMKRSLNIHILNYDFHLLTNHQLGQIKGTSG